MTDASFSSTYQIPAGYNDNKLTLLARDPHCIYAYWEVSDDRKIAFINDFNRELWEKSIPVLKVVNVSKNEEYTIMINDYSNNWYINVPDSNCLYTAEIGRKVSEDFFINLASSNYIATPTNYVSTNTTAYFTNFQDLRQGIFNTESHNINKSAYIEFPMSNTIGTSSSELFGIKVHDFIEM